MESLSDINKAEDLVGPTNKTKRVSDLSLVAVRRFHLLIFPCPTDFLSSGICLQCLQTSEKQY